MFTSYTLEQHDSHIYNGEEVEDCGDCYDDARIDRIERREEALYGDYQERYR